jgi:methylenetetrahydrofolate dehydrogenase (NADP+)/methenyltetrahydrofolate cyclohydrolase
MELIYGKPIAERILAETKAKIAAAGKTPGLSVILVGDDAPSHLYVGLKERAAAEAGIYFEKTLFPDDASVTDILEHIDRLNGRKDVHGIIVQLPLPEGFPTDEIISRIDPAKDTDGFHRETLRRFLSGDFDACPVFPRAIIELLRETGRSFRGEKGIVFANSDLLGKVMRQALLIEGVDAEYALGPIDAPAVSESLKRAHVVVTARGIPALVRGEMLAPGAIVIDGGISSVEGRVVGDADQESVGKTAAFVSPVPGGVGPVTVATLLARVTEAAIGH